MLERIIFSGAGGQGLMFIGKVFAKVMVNKVDNITFFPSYGSEVRGGTANCQIILSSDEIASPIIERADTLVLMNHPSIERFMHILEDDGIVFVNSSLADVPNDKRAIGLPATDIAIQAGDIKSANVAILGAFLRKKGFLTLEESLQYIGDVSAVKGEKATEVNLKALQAGWDSIG